MKIKIVNNTGTTYHGNGRAYEPGEEIEVEITGVNLPCGFFVSCYDGDGWDLAKAESGGAGAGSIVELVGQPFRKLLIEQ